MSVRKERWDIKKKNVIPCVWRLLGNDVLLLETPLLLRPFFCGGSACLFSFVVLLSPTLWRGQASIPQLGQPGKLRCVPRISNRLIWALSFSDAIILTTMLSACTRRPRHHTTTFIVFLVAVVSGIRHAQWRHHLKWSLSGTSAVIVQTIKRLPKSWWEWKRTPFPSQAISS